MASEMDCTMACIAIGRTEFPDVGDYTYFGYRVTITEKWKPKPINGVSYSMRYSGYFYTHFNEKIEFEALKGTKLLKLIDDRIRILNLKAYYKAGKLNADNWQDFI